MKLSKLYTRLSSKLEDEMKSFIEFIKAHPEDIKTKMVFKDWCEEHGFDKMKEWVDYVIENHDVNMDDHLDTSFNEELLSRFRGLEGYYIRDGLGYVSPLVFYSPQDLRSGYPWPKFILYIRNILLSLVREWADSGDPGYADCLADCLAPDLIDQPLEPQQEQNILVNFMSHEMRSRLIKVLPKISKSNQEGSVLAVPWNVLLSEVIKFFNELKLRY